MTTSLPILATSPEAGPDAARKAPAGPWWKGLLLRTYRLAAIIVIVFCIRQVAAESRVKAGEAIKIEEVRPFLPSAMFFKADPSDHAGQFVLDKNNATVGYIVRTMPQAEKVRGYAGPIDTLLVFNPEMKVIGVRIHSTSDTTEHVNKVKEDEYSVAGGPFLNQWNGKSWEDLAGMPAPKEGWDIVSGASLTSGGIRNSIYTRFQQLPQESTHFSWNDVGLIAVILIAGVFTFTHLRSHTWIRRAFQLVLIGYLGYYNGQILAQSLFGGWAANGVAWKIAPALALLAAVALLVPWTTRRQMYCSQICPHGAAQELLGRIVPWRLHVPRSIDRGLRWLPPMLLFLVIGVVMFQLTLNLADIEPFNAYQIHTAGRATIIVEIVGLVAAMFVPMAYCKYGCPTGMLLSFVRSHGKADGFGRKDVVAGLLVAFSATMLFANDAVRHWITG